VEPPPERLASGAVVVTSVALSVTLRNVPCESTATALMTCAQSLSDKDDRRRVWRGGGTDECDAWAVQETSPSKQGAIRHGSSRSVGQEGGEGAVERGPRAHRRQQADARCWSARRFGAVVGAHGSVGDTVAALAGTSGMVEEESGTRLCPSGKGAGRRSARVEVARARVVRRVDYAAARVHYIGTRVHCVSTRVHHAFTRRHYVWRRVNSVSAVDSYGAPARGRAWQEFRSAYESRPVP
jgi:hypothetical protein